MKRYEYPIGALVGIGRNKTAARDDALAQADEALTGPYAPHVIEGDPDHEYGLVVCYRNPLGWSYIFPRAGMCTHSATDVDDCLRRARSHMAQNLADPAGDRRLDLIQNEQDRAQHNYLMDRMQDSSRPQTT